MEKIDNQMQYDSFIDFEKRISDLLFDMQFQRCTPITTVAVKELEDLEKTMYEMREAYDKKRMT